MAYIKLMMTDHHHQMPQESSQQEHLRRNIETLFIMAISTCKSLVSVLIALCCCNTWVQALPMNSRRNATSEPTAGNGSRAGGDEYSFEYDCSIEQPLDYNNSNDTYLDFSIGLNIMKTYLIGVKVINVIN